MVKGMTELLQDLYQPYNERFGVMAHKFEKNGLTGPVLMSPERTAYSCQETKLLVINAEIRGWTYRGWDVATHMENYVRLSENENQRDHTFWEARAEFENRLNIQRGASAWTSLSKFSFQLSALDAIYRKEIESFDELLMGELVRLKPDVVLFMTGHENDARLQRLLDGMKIKKVNGFYKKELVSLHHIFLPKRSFRIAHTSDFKEAGVDRKVLEYVAFAPF